MAATNLFTLIIYFLYYKKYYKKRHISNKKIIFKPDGNKRCK